MTFQTNFALPTGVCDESVLMFAVLTGRAVCWMFYCSTLSLHALLLDVLPGSGTHFKRTGIP